MDDLQVTSSSETPEQIQASSFEEQAEPVKGSAPESAPEPPAEDLSKYSANEIHRNPTLRIQKATADAAQAKREAAEFRREAEDLRQQLKASAQPPQPHQGGDPEPQEADFEEYRDFVKAQARWGAREEMREASYMAQSRNRQAMISAAESDRVTWYQKQVEVAGGQSFVDSLTPAVLNISPDGALGVAIMESEMAAQVMTYLSDHPDEIRALSGLHPVNAFRAIGKIEGKLAGMASTAIVPRAVSKAKPPVRTVTGSASSGDVSSDDISFEDFFKRENARERQSH